ncbi:DUF3768 domain-containing protein [Maricaulis sp.]|uniref:DUF3768 domain-containing protein n=1 Tax=Maricaulis sp. TaxID=1486257 RepID=UPI0026229B31|nr:DUF3768 domain-containing protein [Maricaulis sp.]MDF1769456.1 DUF3768 domain-containing protein [Maricaulis sp.]
MAGQNRAARIAQLNDDLRTNGTGGRILITAGINAKGKAFIAKAVLGLKTYTNFSEDNDPYHEHDFGALAIEGEKLFWKIDYYNLTLDAGSEDPADPKVTTRVLTLMLASEY